MMLDKIYTIVYCVIMLIIQIFKGMGLLYPPHIWGMEFTGIILLCYLQVVRINYGFQANRLQHKTDTCRFMFLTILCLILVVQFTFMTTYVLLVEILLGCILIMLTSTQLLFSCYALTQFERSD